MTILRPLLALSVVCLTGFAQMMPAPVRAQSAVAIAELPPYTVQSPRGDWHGPAVDLFRAAADRSGEDFTFVRTDSDDLRGALDGGALAALPLMPEAGRSPAPARSLPFHTDAVGLIGRQQHGGFLSSMSQLFNLGFLRVVLVLSAILLIVGTVIWAVERRNNEDFKQDGSKVKGIGNGFWWAGVTATTIGYGDLVPRTIMGRTVAMVWMLFSMALTAILTAYLVSLTGGGASTSLADNIEGKRIGIVAGSPVGRAQTDAADTTLEFSALSAALTALEQEEVDLVAYPYEAAKAAAGGHGVARTDATMILPAIGLAEDGALRAELDRIILSPAWQRRMSRVTQSN
ncbi:MULTISPECIES: ion channel [Pacificimonas]|nr:MULTISPECIES: ion channel [Pacificimonas]MBZ6378370.1 transporter substrate-binding domain-containing protein [Pacificimonas aurantium]